MAGTVPAVSRDGALTATNDSGGSATLLYHQADHAIDGLVDDGAQPIKAESGGHLVGLRKGDRGYPTFKVSCIVASGVSAFEELILGTDGGTSTTSDIGDYHTTDLSWTFNYGGESRAFSMEDCVWTIGKKAGDPMTAEYSCEVLGVVKARDVDGNWVTLISAR